MIAPKDVEHAVGCRDEAHAEAWRWDGARWGELHPFDGCRVEAVEVVQHDCDRSARARRKLFFFFFDCYELDGQRVSERKDTLTIRGEKSQGMNQVKRQGTRRG